MSFGARTGARWGWRRQIVPFCLALLLLAWLHPPPDLSGGWRLDGARGSGEQSASGGRHDPALARETPVESLAQKRADIRSPGDGGPSPLGLDAAASPPSVCAAAPPPQRPRTAAGLRPQRGNPRTPTGPPLHA